MMTNSISERLRLLAAASCLALAIPASVHAQQAQPQPETPASDQAEGEANQVDDVVVVARNRSERLIAVPAAVTAIAPQALTRAVATDLTKIGELTPSVLIGTTRQTGGGTIGIRGISSPANVAGFEQAVSVAIDGVQTSNGRISGVGFFDAQQVEILRGPQALFFGKNSPAGVISLTSAGPTDTFQGSLSTGYEFVGDEGYLDATISGPITDRLSYRLALRNRNLKGWMYNDARPIANPFYNPATGAGGQAILPGAGSERYGNEETLGRFTLEYRPTDNITATLKVFHSDYHDDSPGMASQNIGPCTDGLPRMYGFVDPYGECKADNHTSNGDAGPVVGQGVALTDGTGTSFGNLDFTSVSGRIVGDFGPYTVTSITGYNHAKVKNQYNLDQTVFAQLYVGEQDKIEEFSQELRLNTNYEGPLNFTGGLFFQRTDRFYHASTRVASSSYNPANGRHDATENTTDQQGTTYSAFGQVRYDLSPTLELAAGARYTDETKDDIQTNLYGFGAFNVTNIVYPGETRPGVLTGTLGETNWSPEATLTWRPDSDHTLYAAYKTGFKSGGYQAALPVATTRIGDLDFNSETVKGFEVGGKAVLLGRRLRINSAAFAYEFSDLQVNAYDPVRITFVVSNAGKVEQRGAEFDLNYGATDALSLHTAVTYVRNRFSDYVGQCYSYAFPTGSTRATATPPPGCEFANTTTLTLQQNHEGRAPARSPDWSGNAGFVYDREMAGLNWTVTGDAFYTSRYYASDTKSPGSIQNAFWRANASITASTLDDRIRLALIGRNLTNEYYLTFASDRTGGVSVPGTFGEQRGSVARGREVLLQLTYAF
ncbi:TonB-dependent receptor [uncultured Brevundimonas sp.]|uniref:TonB-dependent receptor n=1 Tax=uncultured Brevundimonas sp. TaxID=213418 RepID=UPI0025F2BBF0|nr:TonB-dependent receptor [uncultured Brevundimonas sp.]